MGFNSASKVEASSASTPPYGFSFCGCVHHINVRIHGAIPPSPHASLTPYIIKRRKSYSSFFNADILITGLCTSYNAQGFSKYFSN